MESKRNQEQVDINLSSSEDEEEANDTINNQPDHSNVIRGQSTKLPATQKTQKKKNPFESDNPFQNSSKNPMLSQLDGNVNHLRMDKTKSSPESYQPNNKMSNLNSQNARQQKSSLYDPDGNIDDSEFPEEMFSIVSGIQAPKTNDIQKPNVANVDQANLNQRQQQVMQQRANRNPEPSSLLSESNLNAEDPLTIPDIAEVHQIFPEQDPAVLMDIYQQVNRNKDLLMETVLNGGVLPEHLSSALNQRQEQPDDAMYLNNLVGMDNNPQASQAALQRQMRMMSQAGSQQNEEVRRISEHIKNIDPNDQDMMMAAKIQEKELKRAQQLDEQLRIEEQIKMEQRRQSQIGNGGPDGIGVAGAQMGQHHGLGMTQAEYEALELQQQLQQIEAMESQQRQGQQRGGDNARNRPTMMQNVKSFFCCNTSQATNRQKSRRAPPPQVQQQQSQQAIAQSQGQMMQ